MAKLYPPYIEGTIPAFYTEKVNGTVQTILTVPFSMNRSVGKKNVGGFSLKMKTVNSNVFVYSNLKATSITDYDIEDEYVVEFDLGAASELKVGNFYKVQLAYVDNTGEIGYYSTVGIVKYTTKPKLSIANLKAYAPNACRLTYYGNYSQQSDEELTRDATEKVYSYQFTIMDSEDNVVLDSGELIHNNENNIETYSSVDAYSFPDTLEKNIPYYLQYTVTTVNKLKVSSPRYKIVNKLSLEPEIKATLEAVLNYDNGYIAVNLKGTLNVDGDEAAATGAFLITRTSSDSNFTLWHEVMRFQLHGQLPSRKLLIDYTIEQGKEYQYALQQYSDSGLYSEKMVSNIIMSDFEDAFLYDGTRQLKIKYNPKVSSFKIDKPEAKVETIGSKYPFFFRNGNVEYREFPIGGLISYLADEEELFMTNEELNLENSSDLYRIGTFGSSEFFDEDRIIYNSSGDYFDINYFNLMKQNREKTVRAVEQSHVRTTNYLDYSIAAERQFKMTVLEWLTNGQPKLFRSPGEGNYMVRLMNVSLSPEDKTSRVIHSFTATAYEVAPCDYKTLVDFNIIDTTEENITQLRWETIELATTRDMSDDSRYTRDNINDHVFYAQGPLLIGHRKARTVTFSDMNPGDIVYVLTTEKAYRSSLVFNKVTNQYELKNPDTTIGKIQIGATGTYTLDLNVDILYIGVPADAHYNGLVTYSFYNDAQNVFNAIVNVDPIDYLGQQFIGKHDNILNNILNIKNLDCTFLYLHFTKRDIGQAYYQDGTWYRDGQYSSPITSDPTDDYANGDIMQEQGYYADPLMIYKYTVNEFTARVSGYREPITIPAVIRVDNSEVESAFEYRLDENNNQIPYVFAGYYYFNENHELVSAGGTRYNNSRKYYIKMPFEFYYDPFNPVDPFAEELAERGTLIISPASYHQAIQYLQDTLGAEPDAIIDGVEQFANTFTIDNYTIDLTETGKYNIDFRYDFKNVSLNHGVVLECGYEVQEVTYSVESDSPVTSQQVSVQYHNLHDSMTQEAYSDFLENRTNAQAYYTQLDMLDYASDLEYLITVLRPYRSLYPTIYPRYIELVTHEEALWEEAHTYYEE